MSITSNVSDRLRESIAELTTEIDRLTDLRSHLLEVVDKCDAIDPPTRAPRVDALAKAIKPAKPAAPPAKKPAAKQPDSPCPECGKVCAGGTGLAAHMRHAHGTPAGGSKVLGGANRNHHAGGAIPFVRPTPDAVTDLEQAAALS